MASGIYVIHNTKNGKVYFGQAQDIHWRWTTHKNQLRKQHHVNRFLQADWNQYGEKAFEFKIVEQCSVEELDEREQYWLDIYMPKQVCYNIKRNVQPVPRKPKHDYGFIPVNVRGDKEYVLMLKERAFMARMKLGDYVRHLLDMEVS